LSIDHKPDRSDERQRIEEAGGFVVWAGETWSSWEICIPLLFLHLHLLYTCAEWISPWILPFQAVDAFSAKQT
jgi:hypothetical protein